MAGTIRIVTDSSAQFVDPGIIQRYNIAVVPLMIRMDGAIYHEGIDINPDQFLRELAETKSTPVLLPPSAEQFAAVYTSLSNETDKILSIHLSRAMHSTWQQARNTAESLLGRCDIAVLDSQTTSIGLALLVEAAARLAEETDSLDTVVRTVRKLISHIYSIFSVETLDYMHHNELLGESQAILGDMLGIRPFLTIEEGELMAMEKVRTHFQVVDKLVEFVSEFAAIEQLAILRSASSDEYTHALRERLALDFPTRQFPMLTYNPSLACYVGPDATGIMIFEGSLDVEEDDFDDREDDL
jgi:DegV family protein with EDD domain